MPETPEIPEAKDPFEKMAAVTVAILAVILAVLGNKADSARTEAIIKTNEAANQWAYFQAKGIKGNIASAEREMLGLLSPVQTAAAESPKNAELLKENVERLKGEAERYKGEQEKIKEKAEELKAEAAQMMKITEGCEHGSLALQIGIVLASVSILARSRAFWIVSVILGLLGAVVGGMAFFIAH